MRNCRWKQEISG
jgi:hypothetical protein